MGPETLLGETGNHSELWTPCLGKTLLEGCKGTSLHPGVLLTEEVLHASPKLFNM